MAACHSVLWRSENRGQLVRVCPQQSERLGMSAHITSHRTPTDPSPSWQGLWTLQCPEVPMNSSLLLVWSHPLILSPLWLPHNHSDIFAVPVTCELVSDSSVCPSRHILLSSKLCSVSWKDNSTHGYNSIPDLPPSAHTVARHSIEGVREHGCTFAAFGKILNSSRSQLLTRRLSIQCLIVKLP